MEKTRYVKTLDLSRCKRTKGEEEERKKQFDSMCI